jgi:hypothetical protein
VLKAVITDILGIINIIDIADCYAIRYLVPTYQRNWARYVDRK